MTGPNVSVSRDLVNDYIYRVLGCIDISVPDPEELKKARQILLELSQYIIQSNVKDAALGTRPAISRH